MQQKTVTFLKVSKYIERNHPGTSPLSPETLQEPVIQEQVGDDLPSLLRQAMFSVLALIAAIGLVLGGIRYIQTFDPYIHEVLATQGDPERGAAIFQMNCAVCHGLEANGEVGPALHSVSDHKSKVSLIKQVTSGKTPPMPQFQPSPEDMADLLEYLERL